MTALLSNRVTYVWVFLFLLTVLSWLLADGVQPTTVTGTRCLAVGLLVLAFFKVRLVIMYFMELQNAPWLLRGLFEIWVVLVLAGTCFLYLMGSQV